MQKQKIFQDMILKRLDKKIVKTFLSIMILLAVCCRTDKAFKVVKNEYCKFEH